MNPTPQNLAKRLRVVDIRCLRTRACPYETYNETCGLFEVRGRRPTHSAVIWASFKSSHEQWPAAVELQHWLSKKMRPFHNDSEMHYCLIIQESQETMTRGCMTKKAVVRNESSAAELQLSEPQVRAKFSGDCKEFVVCCGNS